MKAIQTSVIAGIAFFLSTGISFAAEMDDLDLTIRVVESDDVSEMHNELSLPEMISSSEREHAEGEADHSMSQGDGAREHGLESAMDARDEHEDEMEDHDEAREDNGDINEEHGAAHEEETHEEMHEREDAEREMNSGSTSGG